MFVGKGSLASGRDNRLKPTDVAARTEAQLRLLAAIEQADPRMATLRADVAQRLRGACAHLPPDRFETLVDDICAMKLRAVSAKSARRSTPTGPARESAATASAP